MADTFLSEHWNQFGVTSARDAIIVYLHALLLSEEFTQSSPSVSVINTFDTFHI